MSLETILLLLFVGVMVAIVAASRRSGAFSGSIRAENDRLAAYLGRPDPVGVRAANFPKFSADPGEVEVVVDRDDLQVFDYRVVRNQGQADEKIRRIPCVVAQIDAWCPQLSISRGGSVGAPAALGLPEVEFESGMFNDELRVVCEDARFAHALVDQRLMEWLLLLPSGWGIQTNQDKLLVFGREAERSMQFDPVIAMMKDLLPRVPADLGGLFPRLT